LGPNIAGIVINRNMEYPDLNLSIPVIVAVVEGPNVIKVPPKNPKIPEKITSERKL
jgi:hypothetical protein